MVRSNSIDRLRRMELLAVQLKQDGLCTVKDLAHQHGDLFKAVISVEGALHIEGSTSEYSELHHPQVSNEYKARLMDGLMYPTSPALRI